MIDHMSNFQQVDIYDLMDAKDMGT